MTTIPPTGSAIPNTTQQTVTNPNATMDQNGFLKMFIAQMQNQDPTSPQDASQSTQQMATFSMVQQLTTMATQNAQIANSLSNQSAIGLIGKTVSYVDSTGVSQTGAVQSVATATGGKSTLTVAGKSGIDPTSIAQVAA